jgi:hypothetical protein
LLRALGLFPSLPKTRLKPATRDLLNSLAQGDWKDVRNLRPGAGSVRELNTFLHGFLIYHLGKLPRGRATVLKA